MKKLAWLLFLFVLAAIAFIVITGQYSKAEATNLQCFCHDVRHNPHTICTSNPGLINGHMGHVQSGFDTLGVCQIPTFTPTPTATPIPSPTPILCGEDKDEDCVTPSPTPEVTPEATPSPSVNQGGPGDGRSDGRGSDPGATQPHTISCTVPFDPPVLNQVKVSGNVITWGWLESDTHIEKYSIIYGKSPDKLIYGWDNIPAHNVLGQEETFEVRGLDTNTTSWAQVWAWKNGCPMKSNIFDP